MEPLILRLHIIHIVYGGLKFNPYWGGPATKEITKDIEKQALGSTEGWI